MAPRPSLQGLDLGRQRVAFQAINSGELRRRNQHALGTLGFHPQAAGRAVADLERCG